MKNNWIRWRGLVICRKATAENMITETNEGKECFIAPIVIYFCKELPV